MSDLQTSLFDATPGTATQAHARRSDPATSHDAAHMLTVDGLRPRQAAVLRVLREKPGDFASIIDRYVRHRKASYTPDADWPQQAESGIRTRVSELVAAGLARDSGKTVKLRSGRRAIIWEAT